MTPPPKPVVAPPRPDAKPLKKIRCTSCKAIIPIFTEERPLDIQCPSCGKRGRLLK
jgi:DNA-directed RNA polymerase subunit RPC12/RpoP